MEQITASLACIPEREAFLEQTVASMLPQVDVLNAFLNGWEHVPKYLLSPKINVARSQDHEDRGDAGKAWWTASVQGYHFFCDDDIIMPADHVARTIEGIEKYGRKAVVGWQGSIIMEETFEHYYDRRSRYILQANERIPVDTQAHVLGTCLCGYHTSTIEVTYDDFKAANMADIWLAVLGKQQQVPFIVLAHEAGRFEFAEQAGGIYLSSRDNLPGPRNTRELQSQIVRQYMPWPRLPLMPKLVKV